MAYKMGLGCGRVEVSPHEGLSRPAFGRKVMEWFGQKTSIAGIQVPNWMIVLGVVIVIWLAYSLMH
jgi:hypothetical protein